MVDLDKQFAAMADVSEEDTAYDFVIDEDLRVIAVPERGVVLGVEGDKDANCRTPAFWQMSARQAM